MVASPTTLHQPCDFAVDVSPQTVSLSLPLQHQPAAVHPLPIQAFSFPGGFILNMVEF